MNEMKKMLIVYYSVSNGKHHGDCQKAAEGCGSGYCPD